MTHRGRAESASPSFSRRGGWPPRRAALARAAVGGAAGVRGRLQRRGAAGAGAHGDERARRGRARDAIGSRAGGVPRRPPGAHLPLVLGPRRPAHRPHPRPLADAVLRPRRRHRLRPHRLPDRRRARLDHPRAGAAARCSTRCASSGTRRRGPSRAGVDRLPGLLLPLPRHGDRDALRAGRAVDHRHHPPARRRPVLRRVLRPRRRRGARDPRARREALPAGRLELGAARRAAGRHGLAPGEGVHRLRLARLQRGDDPLRPRPRLADASRSSRRRGRRGRAPTTGDTFQGQEHLLFAPLFGHQYSHVWIDFRGIRDAYMRGKGIDYFENSRRATLAQRA